ncbi:MAG: DUF1838 family protein [Pseudomonadota bacterium]
MDEPASEDQRYVARAGYTRRTLLGAAAAMVSGCVAPPGPAGQGSKRTAQPGPSSDSSDPSWRRKLLYAASDANVTWSILGRKFGLRGSQLTPLWETNTVAFSKIRYGAGGAYSVTTLEVVFYTELDSERRLENWLNPYKGTTRKVFLPDPQPVTSTCDAAAHCERTVPESLSITEQESDPYWLGNHLWAHSEKQIEVRATDAGRPVFSSTEFLSYQGKREDLEQEAVPGASLNLEIISDWLPWMDMAEQEGGLYTRASGSKLRTPDDLPGSTLRLLQSHFPKIARNPFQFNQS